MAEIKLNESGELEVASPAKEPRPKVPTQNAKPRPAVKPGNAALENGNISMKDRKPIQTDKDGNLVRSGGGGAVKKKTFGEKMKESFVKEDVDNIGDYIIFELVVPTIKNTLFDVVSNTVQMVLFGSANNSGRSSNYGGRSSGRSSYNYGSCFNSRNDRRPQEPQRRRRGSMTDLIFDYQSDAKDALSDMLDVIDSGYCLTIDDYYEICLSHMNNAGNIQIERDAMDVNWGWYRLNNVPVRPYDGGWVIELPKPTAL